MRIALVNFSHTSQRVGGVETRYSLLEKVFHRAGHDVTLISTSFTPDKVVQQCLSTADLTISDSAIGKVSNCPMISIFGNPWQKVIDGLNQVGTTRSNVHDILQAESKWHALHSTFRVAVSDFMASEMSAQGIMANSIIPNPADTDFFQARSAPKTPLILWVGSGATIKNYTQFQKIVVLWSRQHPGYPVQWQTVLKHPDGKDELNRLQMRQEYAKASLVVCTSHAEGCSNSLLEAIASGVPIVTTRTGLFWNWWDNRLGIRVPSSEGTADFLTAIKSILENGQEYNPRQAAFDRGLDYPTWAKTWQDLAVKVGRSS